MEEERGRLRRRQEQRLVQLELDAVNMERLKKKQKEAQESLDMDLKIINEYIAQDELEKKIKTAKREALRREMQMYRDHLLEQKLVEKEREKEIEYMYRLEDEKVRIFFIITKMLNQSFSSGPNVPRNGKRNKRLGIDS